MARYFVVAPPQDRNAVMTGIQAKGNVTENQSARESATQPGTVVADLEPATANHLLQQGARLYEDVQFKIFDDVLPSDPAAHYWRSMPSPMFEAGAAPAVTISRP